MFMISMLHGKIGKMWVVYTDITFYFMVFSYFFEQNIQSVRTCKKVIKFENILAYRSVSGKESQIYSTDVK